MQHHYKIRSPQNEGHYISSVISKLLSDFKIADSQFPRLQPQVSEMSLDTNLNKNISIYSDMKSIVYIIW